MARFLIADTDIAHGLRLHRELTVAGFDSRITTFERALDEVRPDDVLLIPGETGDNLPSAGAVAGMAQNDEDNIRVVLMCEAEPEHASIHAYLFAVKRPVRILDLVRALKLAGGLD